LGVVLYICLCGFPPFSDELYDAQNNPYTLAQQILGGRFDYPSPYWDSVGDPALDLIDRMLTVDADKRITIEDCLQHPWTTGHEIPATQLVTSMSSVDSTEGLVGQFASQLDFSRRKPVRERTLLSTLNEIHVSRVIPAGPDEVVKVFEKNEGDHAPGNGIETEDDAAAAADPSTPKKKKVQKKTKKAVQEATPAAHRAPEEFMQMGGKGDQVLFGDDDGSRYVSPEKAKEVEEVEKKRKNGAK
jgi:serine/threonine-protein kinase Chk2